MSGQLEKGWEQVTVRVSENYHKVLSFLNYKYINEKLGKKIIDNALIYSLDRLVVDGFKYKIIPFKGTREPKGFTLKETTTKKGEETTTKKPDVTTTGSSNQEVTTGTLTDGSSVKSPAKVKKVKISAKKAKVTITWKKNKKAKGYEIRYATNKKFKKASKVNVKKNNKTKKVLTKIKSNKVYYIKVRAYVIVKGKKVYGKYSKVRKIRSK